jgi:hypothetical protein
VITWNITRNDWFLGYLTPLLQSQSYIASIDLLILAWMLVW